MQNIHESLKILFKPMYFQGYVMKLTRYKNNPIIKPEDFKIREVGSVFNCGVTLLDNGSIGLLYRSVPSGYKKDSSGIGYDNYISSIGYAESLDGFKFSLNENPVLYGQYEWDKYGCEDPRITKFRDGNSTKYLITYTALSKPAFSGLGDRVAVADTADFINYKKYGVVIPGVNDKDAVFFPERIMGKIALLHRIPPDIQLVYFDDFDQLTTHREKYWKDYFRRRNVHTVLKPEYEWEISKIGAGPPPVKTDDGWILIYHGVSKNNVYSAGIVLLDLDDPSKVIGRSPVPILEPELDYEKYGDVNNVVFPEGALILDDELYVYYGAGDRVCCLAISKVSEILDYLKNCH